MVLQHYCTILIKISVNEFLLKLLNNVNQMIFAKHGTMLVLA